MRNVSVVAPHVFLCLLREEGEVPVVYPDDRGDPPCGTTRAGDLLDRGVEQHADRLRIRPTASAAASGRSLFPEEP